MKRSPDIESVCLAKGRERYIVLYRQDTVGRALLQLGKWAANPRLTFTWSDAAKLTREIRDSVMDAQACRGVGGRDENERGAV